MVSSLAAGAVRSHGRVVRASMGSVLGLARPRTFAASSAQQAMIAAEGKHGAHNYHPLPVVLRKGSGVHVWDVDGKKYFDFLSAYGAVNQGHCHPKIIDALKQQVEQLTLTSRAFHSEALVEFVQFMTKFFGYDRVLPMNTGVEAGDTAVKLARRWGYDVKKIPENQARVVFAKGNFWGRSIAAISSSDDPSSYTGFGPFVPNFDLVPYNDVEALEKQLKKNGSTTAAFMVEPVQGEAGVIVPEEGYMQRVKALCEKHRVLLIADEIQAGLGRCGTMLACDHDRVRPDILVLGKALSGGLLPVSAALASHEIMLTVGPGEHGSTYGGNPVACNVTKAALEVLRDEKLVERSATRGEQLRERLRALAAANPSIITAVRGRGLMNAIEINPDLSDKYGPDGAAWELCLRLLDRGLLAKPTHKNIVRLTPPLCITEAQIDEAADIMASSLKSI